MDCGHPGRLCAPERELCKRCDGSGVGADPAAAPGRAARRATANHLPAAGGGRDLLPAAGGLPVADAAAGLPAAQHGLRLLPGLDRGRGLGARPRRALSPDPGAGRPRREPDRGNHRQPERENRPGAREMVGTTRESGSRAASGTWSPTPRPDAASRSIPPASRIATARRWSSTGSPCASRFSNALRRRRLPGARVAAASPRPVEIIKRTDAGFVVQPKRWVIERTFAWACINRRLARDVERAAETVRAFSRSP